MLDNVKGMINSGLDRVFEREAIFGLYCVRVHLDLKQENSVNEFMVRGKKDLERFLAATLQLHYVPGINPHNGSTALEAQLIAVAPLSKNGPYWWSTPGLWEDYNPNGAAIYKQGGFDAVWARPDAEIPRSWGYKTT